MRYTLSDFLDKEYINFIFDDISTKEDSLYEIHCNSKFIPKEENLKAFCKAIKKYNPYVSNAEIEQNGTLSVWIYTECNDKTYAEIIRKYANCWK